MSTFTWLGIAVKNTGAWIGKAFTSIKDDADKVAISITEAIKATIADGALPVVATLIDDAFKTHIGETVVAFIAANINKVLAVELAIQGLPDNPTEADIQTFSNNVITAITGLSASGKSKLWTTLAAQTFGIIQEQVNNNTTFTFAMLVDYVEEEYQDYLTDLASAA